MMSSSTAFATSEKPVKEDNSYRLLATLVDKISSEIRPAFVGYHKTETVVETTKRNNVFVGYLTDTWVKASSYNLGESYSVSSGISFKGVSGTVHFSHSISATISANSKKYSKLAGYVDITIKKVRVNYWAGGMKNTTYRLDISYRDKYFKVKYK